MRNIIIPTLCALALLGTTSLSLAAPDGEQVKPATTADQMLQNTSPRLYDSWINDITNVPY